MTARKLDPAELVAIIRAYQHANTREAMEAADARAVALLGPAPMDELPLPKPAARRGKARK